MNKAIRRLAVGAALAAFTLTGCASWPGTGVRVGETRISDDAIVRASVAIQDIRGAGDADATEVLQTAASGFALGEALGVQAAGSVGVQDGEDAAGDGRRDQGVHSTPPGIGRGVPVVVGRLSGSARCERTAR